ncbi:hypothetical protein CSIM01_06628 [Colletotrichum simmondsii]|uniref:Uncharacterized protein n=1 Tax=Colletotrichum simmondsii TaxID=703756 RepID=A0A135SUH2_9PEZI|nr:hypothetical protein CSIM01_06628 [Colletotrichum simmondsii]
MICDNISGESRRKGANADSHLVQVTRMCSSLAQLSIAQETKILIYGAEIFSMKNLKPRDDHRGRAWLIRDLAPVDSLGNRVGRPASAHLGLLDALMGFSVNELRDSMSNCDTTSVLALIWGIGLTSMAMLLQVQVASKGILDRFLPMTGVALSKSLHKNLASRAWVMWLFA